MPKTNPLPILPQSWQLPYLASGEASLIIVPVDLGGVFAIKTAKYEYGKWIFRTKDLIIKGAAKYQVGFELYCQEEWAQLPGTPTAFIQRSWLNPDSGDDFKRRADRLLIDKSDWQPAETMPKIAARIWLRVTSVNCHQFGQLTGEDERAMGWRGPGDMPAFLGENDWVWAVSVKAIAPF